MTTALTISDPVRLVLVAPAESPALAADLLADHLAIAPQAALRRLACVSGSLAEGLSRDRASRLASLLATLGLRVRIEQGATPGPDDSLLDVSLQSVSANTLHALAGRLARLLHRPLGPILQDILQPGGVVLRGLTAQAVDQLRRSLRRVAGVHMSTCHPEQAVFDLFARRAGRLSGDLMRHLTTIGLTPSLFNGALAGGLDRRTLDHVLIRFGDSVFGLERSFQRLDLYLNGSSHMSNVDIADFLATRAQAGCRFDYVPSPSPLRIETGLSYTAARQFQVDYEMIGLQTFARLADPALALENP